MRESAAAARASTNPFMLNSVQNDEESLRKTTNEPDLNEGAATNGMNPF